MVDITYNIHIYLKLKIHNLNSSTGNCSSIYNKCLTDQHNTKSERS